MRVFMTGATGFIGRHVVSELVAASHEVVGLARSAEATASLSALGASSHQGRLEDLNSLRSGAEAADAVIHLGFENDFSRFKEVCEVDQAAIETFGEALAGSAKPLLVPNGLAGLAPDGRAVTEADPIPEHYPFPRVSEQTALRFASEGITTCVIRLPQVHDITKLGLVSRLIQVAQGKGTSAYIGDGSSRWAAAHVSDVARLFRLVLETPERGAIFHAVAEDGVEVRTIATTISLLLGVPERSLSRDEARAHFGPLSMFVGGGMAASAITTREKMNWQPTGPTLIADLEHADATHPGSE